MNPLAQSAQDAAIKGDQNMVAEIIQQALSTKLNDIEALLTLAALAEEDSSKRQLLNRVLSLDATNKTARDMMLEMDRAELNKYRSQFPATQNSKTSPNPVFSPLSQTNPMPKQFSDAGKKPLVFRPSSVSLVTLSIGAILFCCMSLLIATQSITSSLPTLLLAAIFAFTAFSLFSKVEVDETGIRSSSLLRKSGIRWNEISGIKSNASRKTLELYSNSGDTVKVSTQVSNYAALVDILREKRPDLFTEEKISSTQQSAPPTEDPPSPSTAEVKPVSPTFSETRTFQKSFFKQYGLLLVLIPLFFLFVWMALASPESRIAFIVVAVACLLFMFIPFIQVASFKVEPNKLTIETSFEAKELIARQIKEIKMQSTRGRYGRVNHFVNVIPLEGKSYPLSGFSEGDEVIYGYLMNWWNTYKDH
jgi:hypothetical protein